jgi:hypothetical protein
MKIVCFTCGLGPRNGLALFSTAINREQLQPEDRHCAQHLPLREVQRRVEAKAPIDADIAAIFKRRLTEAAKPMAAE